MRTASQACAFLAHLQGLLGEPPSGGPAEVLARAGWARTVGGANPYLTLFSRSGAGRAEVDRALADHLVEEVPSARSCMYLLPSDHVWIGLRAAEGGSAAEQRRGLKVGVTAAETEKLCEEVLAALKDGPLAPNELRSALGEKVRSLGEAGKKQGLSTNLPLALGRLQEEGNIGRVPWDGRLDNERYRYCLWQPSPLEGAMDRTQALRHLASLYWGWIGLASLAHFRWFTGLGVQASKSAIEGLGLVEVGDDGLLATPSTQHDLAAFSAPGQPDCRLVSCLDSLFLLRRDVTSFMGEEAIAAYGRVSGRGMASGGLADLEYNAILDRGMIVGLWEYDPAEGEIVYVAWGGEPTAIRRAVEKTEAFVRNDLGDCRSFSLDSPKSRQPRLRALRA
ncbi:MAG: winged helix DNA-binding domain-containing protein [Fimbriimonadaceae bacterium]|nr:winged helix DNA-binding domain-containing protein [Fimbriimonadaceae bacterium]